MYSIGIQSKENKIIHEHHEKSLNAYVENEYYIVINKVKMLKKRITDKSNVLIVILQMLAYLH